MKDSPDHRDHTPSQAKNDLLGQAYYKYARDCGHFPESYRVLKILYERHSEDKHIQSRDISIHHFQYGGVCLHFTCDSFNTVFGKSNFKVTLIFSEMTLSSQSGMDW